MNSRISSIKLRKFGYIRCNGTYSCSACGKDPIISTKKSPLNSYSNPQTTLARLPYSDGSKRLLVECWQNENAKYSIGYWLYSGLLGNSANQY